MDGSLSVMSRTGELNRSSYLTGQAELTGQNTRTWAEYSVAKAAVDAMLVRRDASFELSEAWKAGGCMGGAECSIQYQQDSSSQ